MGTNLALLISFTGRLVLWQAAQSVRCILGEVKGVVLVCSQCTPCCRYLNVTSLLAHLLAASAAVVPTRPVTVQTGHPAFMYVVSELLKVFASEPAADTNMGHILVALLRGGCQKLTTLQVSTSSWACVGSWHSAALLCCFPGVVCCWRHCPGCHSCAREGCAHHETMSAYHVNTTNACERGHTLWNKTHPLLECLCKVACCVLSAQGGQVMA